MPPSISYAPKQNRILAALPPKAYSRLAGYLDLVRLSDGDKLHASSDKPAFLYFPTTCVVSLIFISEDGSSAELAMTGNDGLVGIPLVLGGETSIYKVVVKIGGWAYRLPAEVMRWQLEQGGSLHRLALSYTQALMTQMAQSVVCNRYHAIEQQLCRWLLLSLDQMDSNQLHATHEVISNMLGVRREAVTEAAGKLQAAGLIQYRRGNITVTDRPGLEARGCECYGVVKAEYDRLFRLLAAAPAPCRARPTPATLRQRAEARLKQAQFVKGSQWDAARLLHELQVHQIELDMRNEELSNAYDEVDSLRRSMQTVMILQHLTSYT